MKKGSFVLNVLMAALIVVGSAGLSYAGDLKVSAFADILYFVTDEAFDAATGNAVEQQFVAKGELSLEKENDGPIGNVTFRIDLDFPGSSSAGLGGILAKTNMSVTGGLAGANTFGDTIEQAKFDWAIPAGPINLNLVGGVFNSPIGYEAQDAPDRDFVSYGQLFGMVPSNLAGVQIGLEVAMFSVSILYTDEWRSLAGGATLPTAEENSIGLTLGFEFHPSANLYLGYLSSEQNILVQDEDIIDIIFSGEVTPSNMKIFYAAELLVDENNTGFAITAGFGHNTSILPHQVAIRIDSVDCDATTAFGGCGGAANTPTSFTLSASADIASTLKARLEYVTYDADALTSAADSDMVLLQFVATLM